MNGTELTRTSAAEQHCSWPELVAHAARDTRLRAGDVLGSGTLNRGCLLELGPLEGERFLEPGDEVTIAPRDWGRAGSSRRGYDAAGSRGAVRSAVMRKSSKGFA